MNPDPFEVMSQIEIHPRTRKHLKNCQKCKNDQAWSMNYMHFISREFLADVGRAAMNSPRRPENEVD